MPKIPHTVLVLTLLLAARLAVDRTLPRRWRPVVVGLVLGFGLVAATAAATARSMPPAALPGLRYAAYLWIAFEFYAVAAFAALDTWRWLGGRRERPLAVDPGRRAFLARAGTAAAGFGAVGVAGWGRRRAWELARPEVEVAVARWPRALDGFRVTQLSDLHVGVLLGGAFVREVVEQTNASRPDVIVLTGDIVDAPLAMAGGEIEALAGLRARHGVYLVTGNHEYYNGAEAWLRAFERAGIRPLLNERVPIGDAGGRGGFDLVGIADPVAYHHVRAHTPDLARTLAGRDPERAVVLLAHRPRQVEDAAGHDVDVQLSGHTHGGQMLPFGLVAMLSEPYLFGLHRHASGTQVYVTRGAGFVGPPVRVLAPAEVPTIVLTAA